MKQLKFRPELIDGIISGQKRLTWRLFDDKNLAVGDTLQLLNSKTMAVVAQAVITKVEEKELQQTTPEERAANGFSSDLSLNGIIVHYHQLYQRDINQDTIVKIISLEKR